MASLLAAQYTIDSFTITGGGGTSSGGPYSVTATIGQLEAGQSSGQNFSLVSGFWNLVTDIPVPGAPLLKISKTGPDTVVVSWPSASTDWFLQQNGDLSTINWTNVSTAPADEGTTKSVVISLVTGSLFFRLSK
jgi:hypothetical protein